MGKIVLITCYILLVITFFITKRRLHLLELIFIWLLTIFMNDAYFMIVSLNYSYIVPSLHYGDIFLRLVYQQIFTPMIVIWAMERWVSKHGLLYKLGTVIFYSLVLMLLKIWLHRLEIIQYSDMWKLEWSYLESLLLLSATGIGLLIFRAIMRKDGIPYESS